MKTVYRTFMLHQVQIAQGLLEAHGIISYVHNEYVNNVAVMPVAENYLLKVGERDFARALEILQQSALLEKDLPGL